MIRCNFARLLGERKLKISDVARDTGINRGTLTRLYYETTERVELGVLDQLCEYFSVDLPALLERVEEMDEGPLE
jgi:putative transcriptional regulator